ncbi:MAG TPA: HlyD family efflux transporter periplasmic adaptor subunit [Burkholderiales bacterium]|nr:HlyD family efflux transporter periplasmic adaptor subunit [Burkholderiales bacterium]
MSSVKSEIHEQAAHGNVADLAARRAYEQAWACFAREQTPEEFCSTWLVIQSHAIGGVSDGMVVLLKPGAQAFTPVAFYPEDAPDRDRLARITENALKEGRGIVEQQASPENDGERGPRWQLACPVRLDGQVRGVAAVDIEARTEAQLQAAVRQLQWGSGWLELLLRRHAGPQDAERVRLKLALDLVATLLEHPRFSDSATAFTTELAALLGCDRVSLGILKGRRVRIAAVSHSPQFDRRASLMLAVEGAMEEAIDQEAAVVSPPAHADRPVVALAHEALLRESQAGAAATFPLAHGDRVVGAVTLERASGYRFDAATLVICEAVASVAGPIVDLKRGNEIGLPGQAWKSAQALWDRFVGPGHAALKLATPAAVVILAFLAFAAGDYRVSANSTLEGTVQRAITAPINGFVKEAPLRAGNTVAQGQIIGRFDDRDLKLERVKLASQRDQYVRQYREAMGKRERAQAQIVSAQIAQADAQLALVDEQLARTVMVAPFDGLIVSGDLSQNLGSPVERGQVLFEVAPLESYRVVLQVDERDIAHITAGQRGQLTVSSIPGERFGFTVNTVTPVNTAKDGRNFFRVEASLEDQPGARLRPGMEGVGKVYVDERKLVWIWTHGLTDWVRLWLWTWLP